MFPLHSEHIQDIQHIQAGNFLWNFWNEWSNDQSVFWEIKLLMSEIFYQSYAIPKKSTERWITQNETCRHILKEWLVLQILPRKVTSKFPKSNESCIPPNKTASVLSKTGQYDVIRTHILSAVFIYGLM